MKENIKSFSLYMRVARWSSGLRLRPFTAATRVRVPSGSPLYFHRSMPIWRHSSAGRASASHAEGHRFEFCCLHQEKRIDESRCAFSLCQDINFPVDKDRQREKQGGVRVGLCVRNSRKTGSCFKTSCSWLCRCFT